MHGKTRLVRALIFVLCVLMLSSGLTAAARDTTLSCSYVKITENGFVADTFMGVEARYNLNGPTIYCSELIPRFYREVYGVEIAVSDAGPRVTDNSGFRFEEVADAKSGDVLLASAGARGKSYNHWAICKSSDPMSGKMTLFEQNWRWNGCAGINRVISLRGCCYHVYRLVAEDGSEVKTLAELEEEKLAEEQKQAEEMLEQQKLEDAANRLTVVQIRSELKQEAIRAASLVL